jgi:hypothetical protein
LNTHIFKYEIPIQDGEIEIELPENGGVCDIAEQNDKIYLWACVNIHAPLEKIKFRIYGTGHLTADAESLYFLRTVHMKNGLVWHIFIVKQN